ncbi:phosphoribosyl-AMP cyclohydrolase [Limibacter armeniacum]|uniref:phosphoribosyl-AMP cyclohydrolase n=1 Tax=Limibacter armeniacum TaxID=466084 RepID=UPI002FE5AC48
MLSTSLIAIEEGNQCLLQFEKRGGLLPVAVQEHATGQILMLASVSKEAFEKTIRTGKATFWSTSRQALWTKGETSGEYLQMVDILVDCDQDALVYQVTMERNGACHTFSQSGKPRKSCFYRRYDIEEEQLDFIEK